MQSCRECLHFKACEDWVKTWAPEDLTFPFECEDDGLLCDHYNPQTLPPAYIGMKVWGVFYWYNREPEITEGRVSGLQQKVDGSWKIRITHNGYVSDYTVDEFNDRFFFTREAADEYINKEAP